MYVRLLGRRKERRDFGLGSIPGTSLSHSALYLAAGLDLDARSLATSIEECGFFKREDFFSLSFFVIGLS